MKKFLALGLLFCNSVAFGQTAAISNYCVLGASQATTSGLNSSNYLQGVIRQCAVTVYLTGTTNLATIYADKNNTPLSSSFTANTNGSWLFYAATGQGYDVVLSGGIAPNTYATPVTLTDVFPGGGSGGSMVYPASGIAYSTGTAWGSSYGPSNPIPLTSITPFGTSNLSDWTDIGVSNGDCPVWDASTAKWTPGSCGSGSGSSNFQQQLVAPAPGQYVVVYATVDTPTATNAGFYATGGPTGGIVGTIPFDLGVAGTAQIVLSSPALPSYVNPANITAVYAFAVSEAITEPASGTCAGPITRTPLIPQNLSINVNGTGISVINLAPLSWPYLLQQISTPTGISGANFASLTMNLYFNVSGNCKGGAYLSVPLAGYFVYYTGTAPPVQNPVLVTPPLEFSQALSTLSISPTASFQGIDLLPTTVQGLPPAVTSLDQLWAVSDGASSTDCTTGGGSDYVQCISNGTTWGAYSPGAGYAGVTSPGTGGLAGNPGSGQTWEIAPDGDYTLEGCSSDSYLKADGSGCGTPGGGTGVPANIIYATEGNSTVAGCTADSNVLTGGGTDQTVCLQNQLDYLGTAGGGELVLNGAFLISQAEQGSTNAVDGNVQTTLLQTHSNVMIYTPSKDWGVFAAANSYGTMLGNNISGDPTASGWQTNMYWIGGTWNGNNANQSNQYEQNNHANGWVYGAFFGGFNGLEIDDVTILNSSTFAFTLSNGANFVMNKDTVTFTTTVPSVSAFQDGLHLYGTLTNGHVSNFLDNGGDDDPLAFNTDEGVYSYNTYTSVWEIHRYSNSGGAISNILVDHFTINGTGTTMRFIGYTTTNGVPSLSNVTIRHFSGTSSGAVFNSGLTTCSNILIEDWTPTNSGTVVDPNLYGSSCTNTPLVQGFGAIGNATDPSGGTWLMLDPQAGGAIVSIALGTALGAGEHAGVLSFVDDGAAASHWEFGTQGSNHYLDIYNETYGGGTGTDVSVTGSDCGSSFCGSSINLGGGSAVMDRCSGGTLDGAYVAASSTQATACTSGGGSLINTGITTP